MTLISRILLFLRFKNEYRKIVDNYQIVLYTYDVLNFQNIMMVYESGTYNKEKTI